MPCRPAEALGECDCGVCEGRGDAIAWALHAAVMGRWRAGDTAAHIAGGESLDDVRRRFVPFVAALCDQLGDGAAVVVTHGALLVSMLPLVLEGFPIERAGQGLGYTGYVLAGVQAKTLRLERWADGGGKRERPACWIEKAGIIAHCGPACWSRVRQ